MARLKKTLKYWERRKTRQWQWIVTTPCSFNFFLFIRSPWQRNTGKSSRLLYVFFMYIYIYIYKHLQVEGLRELKKKRLALLVKNRELKREESWIPSLDRPTLKTVFHCLGSLSLNKKICIFFFFSLLPYCPLLHWNIVNFTWIYFCFFIIPWHRCGR